MRNLMISAAAVALVMGASAANAQTEQQQTTTTVQAPNGDSQTTKETTTTDAAGYTQYRKTVTSKKHYDAAAFVAPSGFTYRRFNVGEHVPNALLGDSVVLSDYANYALDAPPSGLTWIRDGKDALLIDVRTGEVIQADYDVFNG